jgi:hypothetical protein
MTAGGTFLHDSSRRTAVKYRRYRRFHHTVKLAIIVVPTVQHARHTGKHAEVAIADVWRKPTNTPTPARVWPQLYPSLSLAVREQLLFSWVLRVLLAYCIAWLLNRSPTRYFADPFIFHITRAPFTYLTFTRWFSLFSFEMRYCVVMTGIGDPGLTIATTALVH